MSFKNSVYNCVMRKSLLLGLLLTAAAMVGQRGGRGRDNNATPIVLKPARVFDGEAMHESSESSTTPRPALHRLEFPQGPAGRSPEQPVREAPRHEDRLDQTEPPPESERLPPGA